MKGVPVTRRRADLLYGSLDMLILKTLAPGARHGLGIANRIRLTTNGVFEVKPGSLFPALHRLEQEGWIEGEWGESENNRRARFYQLTSAGRKQLAVEKLNWARMVGAVTNVLETD